MAKITKRPYVKKPEKVLFEKNVYNEKVKVEFWNYNAESKGKDNDVYRDHLSNHRSTYNRLGTEDHPFISETQCMQEQIWSKQKPQFKFMPLVNFTSYPCTDTPGRNKLLKLARLPELAEGYGKTNYISTQQDDYRNPYPSIMKPITMPRTPWLLNRIVRSDLTQNGGTAPPRGFYQCFDTHTPIDHIRALRHFRRQTVNPATALKDFPPPREGDQQLIEKALMMEMHK